MTDDELARRLARSQWPVTMHRLGEPASLDATTPLERVGMMWDLVVQAYAIAGIPIPDYDRTHTPVRVRRLGDDVAP